MKTSEIQELWDQDCQIDKANLDTDSLNSAKLHQKYYKILLNEKVLYRVIEVELKKKTLEKYEFYLNGPSAEEAKRNPDKIVRRRILKTDVDKYIETDNEIITLKHKLDQQKDKLIYLEDILKMIVNRGYAIKNAIDWQKFINAVT